MTTTDTTEIKARQQAMWASGDFSEVATTIVPVAENLVDAADLRAGSRVLDVATGSGNAAIAAARQRCEVTGCDYVPELLERGRERARAERLEIDFVVGDSEELPFGDSAFDAVLSVYGSMFAPDQPKVATEIVRVSRPGGIIGIVSWTPEGFLGSMFKTIGSHVPPPPGVQSPMLWGTEARLEELFAGGVEWTAHERRIYNFRYRSAEEFVDFFITYYGPTLKAFEAAGADGDALRSDLERLATEWNRLDDDAGAVAIPGEYLESVGRRV
ncbi:MAG TPA: methyltransferase domain-containing protein [Solirubrobacterales bacterium]|nr:methyltransferase domain-containing protein [Solirubrobacterales bacterium]